MTKEGFLLFVAYMISVGSLITSIVWILEVNRGIQDSLLEHGNLNALTFPMCLLIVSLAGMICILVTRITKH
jgi:hypothetical protein